MKQRVSSLDVKVIALELSQILTTLRVTNIYDLSTRIFLIKFHKPDRREQLLIDSGFRCHLTSFARATAAAPSPFVTRLRKYLRTRRVTSVSQVGTDRIIEFQFSDGLYKLYLEFYAAGNIVLTDKELNIIALLRNVNEGAEHEQLRVGLKYDLSLRQNYSGIPPLTKERVEEGLQKALERQQDSSGVSGKKSKSKGGDALRKALAVSITEFPPMLVDHALRVVGFDPAIQPAQVLQDGKLLDKLMTVLEEAGKMLTEMAHADIAKGYIFAKKSKAKDASEKIFDQTADSTEVHDERLVYDDFHPFKARQFEENPSITVLEFEGFNKTVDEFFSSIEGQKLQSRLQEREDNAKKKLEQAREDHVKRVGGLQQVQELNIRKARAIEANRERVEEARAAVNGLIAQGMDWIDIGRLIETEQKRRNPVAELIKLPLKLEQNLVTLQLTESTFDEDDIEGNETDTEPSEDEDEGYSSVTGSKTSKQSPERLGVDIDLALTAWANASQYYDQKKSAAVKEEKTLLASSKALKSTEQKIAADLKKGLKQEKELLRPVRKQFWFEKFMYFISSDGYLVLGGRDAQQNDLLYRKYLKKGDVYVHADMHGAASVIIKNNPSTPDAPVPPSTLSQAGNLSVATSSAWDSKAVMAAWWVTADQVSKMTESREYLTTGGFVIRGHKNFLPPAQLLLGFAVMFQISDDSKFRHIKHRIQDEETTPSHLPATKEEISEQREEDEPRRSESDSESDEDFPDARLESDLGNSDEEGSLTQERSNPLQGSDTYMELPEQHNFKESDAGDTEDFIAAGSEKQATPMTDAMPVVPDTASQTKGSTRHLSARERRQLRKGQSPAVSSENPSVDEPDDSTAREVDTTVSAAESTRSTMKNAPLPRGKRGKQKKLAAKYADQDEEDRTLAMNILGSRAGQDQANAQAAEKKTLEEEAIARKQRRREQHLRAQTAGRASEEARRSALEDQPTAGTLPQDDDEEAARLEQVGLDAFTGRPLPGDELLAAVPVCAPWSALSTYKYKVKLQPGAQKKGKAVKEILSKWEADAKDSKKVDQKSEDSERIWPREAELLRAWKETEIIGVIPVSKVRVMMSGSRDGGGDKGKGKAPRGGKGSKKQR